MIAEQLKKAVLQAAIQGKLTEQLPEDGDARELLKRMRTEKARLVKAGKIKQEKPLPEIREEEIPFEIPENWVWVRLADTSEACDYPFADGPFGSNLKSEHYTLSPEVRIIQLSNIGENGWRDENTKFTTYEHLKTIARSEVKPGDLVIAKMMPAGRAIELPPTENKYVLSSDAIKFVPNKLVDKAFILFTINSEIFRKQIYAEVHGITRIRTSLGKVKTYLVPLPPTAEQQRIVERLNNVMLEVEKLAEDENKLDKLEKAFPKKMKGAILQYAIQGKLTEQLPEDGNARELLKEIRAEKARLVKAGKIKKEKPLPEISEDEIPFAIPENWAWARLGSCIEFKMGKTPPRQETSYWGTDIPWVSIADMNSGDVIVTTKERISTKALDHIFHGNIVPKGSLLMSFKLTIGKVSYLGIDAVHNEAIISIDTLIKGNTQRDYLFKVLPFITQWGESKTAIKGKTLNSSSIQNLLVPIPPISEQQRIVEQLEVLLPLCDALE